MPPVGAAIAASWATVSASAAFTFATQTIAGRLLVSVAASALMQAIAAPRRRPGANAVGFGTGVTLRGGTNPCFLPLGRSCTAGQHVCPPMTHGNAGKTPNAYMTYVVLLSNVAGAALDEVIINDEPVTLGVTPHALYGRPVQGKYAGYAWVKYYDGSQTSADPHLLSTYGTYPERPWSSAMIGRGLCYAIATFRFNAELWAGGGHPRIKFVMGSIPLYDVRKDSTAGGSGAHRWANRATWEPSNNPFVQIYNVMRGITLADGDVWGGSLLGSALDTASFMAAMNECDRNVPRADGGTEPQFRTGIEASVDRTPSDYIRELLKGSSGQLVDMGGVWKAWAGGPGVPVLFFTDDDIVVSKPEDFKPFPGLDSSFNAITATYPEPGNVWEPKDAPARFNSSWEAEDQGRRRIANLQLIAVPYPDRVQRIMKAYISEERRFRRHALTLPPFAAVLEPLDAVGWTSVHNGYVAKVFELGEVADDLVTCLQRTALRERDPTDYDYPADLFLPTAIAAPGVVLPPAQGVPDWTVQAIAITDGGGTARRPALVMSWDGDGQDDVSGLQWEVRLAATGVVVSRGSTQHVDVGSTITTNGIVGGPLYQARGKFIAPRATLWTPWTSANAVTPNIGVSDADFPGGGIYNWLTSLGLVVPEIVTSLPTTGNYPGRLVFRLSDGKLWRFRAGAWTVAVDGADLIANTVTAGAIATGTLVQNLFAAGELQASLYPARMEFITASDASWSPKLNGLMQVWCFGAGGGGGACGDDDQPAVGTGGGAGGLSIGFVPLASTGQTYALTVGAGGPGGNPGNADGLADGTNGGQTNFFGNGFLFRAFGGQGGLGRRNITTNVPGGGGGAAEGGSYNYTGGAGGDVDLTAGGHRALASGGGAPNAATGTTQINASNLAEDGVDTLGGGASRVGGRTVSSSFPTDLEVSGFPMRGYDSFIGGSGGASSPSSGGTFGGTSGALGCGGGGGAVRRVSPNGSWARGGNGGDGLIVVIYYRVGNFV
jgi:hypothetical protein